MLGKSAAAKVPARGGAPMKLPKARPGKEPKNLGLSEGGQLSSDELASRLRDRRV